jgi:hypothetical protein
MGEKLRLYLIEFDPSDIELIARKVDEKADVLLQCLEIRPYLCVIFLIEFFHCLKLYNNLSFNQQDVPFSTQLVRRCDKYFPESLVLILYEH